MGNIYKKEDFINLNRKYLRELTVSNIDSYIKILEKGEFIISNESYQNGVKSQGYKLNPMYVNGLVEFTIKPNSRLGKRIIKNLRKRKAHYNRLEPHLKSMKDELMKMEFDYEGAKKWIEGVPEPSKKLSYLTSINHIQDKRLRYFKRNKTNGRLDTNLTNLKSELRQFIKGDYVSIDLKNSQPFLLGVLIDNIINYRDTLCCYLDESKITETFGIKAIRKIRLIHQNQEKSEMVNFRTFYEAVLKGNLYDDFTKSYTEDISRAEAKNIIFRILFSQNGIYQNYKKTIPFEKDKKIFASVYPFIFHAVKIFKLKDHKLLPIYLQQIESYLFIDCIAKELVVNGIVPFTIHDSVLVKVEYRDEAMEIIKRVFNDQIGVIPTFDIKALNKSDLSFKYER
ncbi:hypothetical protein [Tamlana flava]|uniref:hypothetical protein n=1 Tax=Tamlana flava TaxID=3158572 RepID=UPI00351B7059